MENKPTAKYSYQDFKDKSKEGIRKEMQEGMTIASVYFYQTKGISAETFQQWIDEMSYLEQLMWYMNFRNQHLKLYETTNS